MRKAFVLAAAWTMICLGNYAAIADQPPEAARSRWMEALLPLHDEGWENIAVTGNPFVVYVSFRSAVHDGALIVLPVRSEWMVPQEQPPTRIGKFQSLVSRIEFNCMAQTYRHLAETEYAGNNLTGEASTADVPELKDWTNVFPQSAAQQILAAVCSHADGKPAG